MSKIQKAIEKIKLEHENKISRADINNKASFSINSRSEATGAPVITETCNINEMHQPQEFSAEIRKKTHIIDQSMADRRVFNAFRDLRTSVVQRVKESSPIIMVTSCVYGGGGSFVSTNLATVIAMDETKTALLVDCNLSEPGLNGLPLAAENNNGLKDYLQNDSCTVNEIIYPTGIKRLRVIPAGNVNSSMSEYFTSVRLYRLFEEIKQRYSQRYIIVDAPAISENADARILAEVCDYVILVVPYGKVTEDQILKSARAIGKDKLLGTVFNNEPQFPKLAWH